jgi:hypothetical protein
MSMSEMSISDSGGCHPEDVLASEAGMSLYDSTTSQMQSLPHSMPSPSRLLISSHPSSSVQHHMSTEQVLVTPQNMIPSGGISVPVPITKLDIESRLLGRSLRSLAELSAYSSTNGMDACESSAVPTSGVDKTEDSDLESESNLDSENMDTGD